MYVYRLIKRRRAAERERRKHHLIADFEEKVRRYDKEQKELLEKELEKMKNDVLLEAHRRLKRIEKNSVKVGYGNITLDSFGRYLLQCINCKSFFFLFTNRKQTRKNSSKTSHKI